MTSVDPAPPRTAAARSVWRSVGLPSEHGGWGLTAEPVLLGLLVAPSWAGVAIGLAAMLAFLARTPVKIALGDLRRGRRLPRTIAAFVLGGGEVVAILVAAVVAVAVADAPFSQPLPVVLVLLGTELAYDVRSRGRRLVPELAGSVGIAGVAAMVVLADGRTPAAAVAVWLVLASRAVSSVPWVRGQVRRLHGRPGAGAEILVSDGVALTGAASAVVLAPQVLAGSVAVVGVVVLQRLNQLRPASSAVVVGLRQLALGLGVVAATWLGVVAAGGLP